VSHGTINTDVGGQNYPPDDEMSGDDNDPDEPSGQNYPPPVRGTQGTGIDEATSRRDSAANAAPAEEDDSDFNDDEGEDAANAAPPVRGTAGTGNNEWYTPARASPPRTRPAKGLGG
jgi:hypothetical protein